MNYKHWPILYKSLLAVVVLGILSAGATFYAASQMKTIDDSYTGAINGPLSATVYLTRASDDLTSYKSGLWQALTTANDQEGQLATKAVDAGDSGFRSDIASAIKVDPANSTQYQDLLARYDTLAADSGVCGVARSLGVQANTLEENAKVAHDNMIPHCAPALTELSNKITAAVNADIQANKAQNATLSATTRSTTILTVAAVLGGLAAVICGAFWLTVSGVVKPVKTVASVMETMAKGNLMVTVDGQDRKDEIGQVARATESFRKSLLETEQLRKDGEALKIKAEQERKQAMLDLADDFEKSVGGIVSLVSSAATEMQAAAAQLTATAQETSAQSVAVSAAAEQAGANVNAVASSAEELGASVSEIGRQVETSATVAQSAVEEAAQAGAIVTELDETAAAIGGVVDLIAGLASQTNLLALNATIESARAGEAGKGFAVVAAEVKALAAQTAKATTEISEKIAKIQEATGRASNAMQNISGTISSISHSSTAIASAVDQQGAATREIVEAVTQASSGTQEVTSNISGVAQAAEQTGEAASQVLSSSQELAMQAERLHAEMDKFLSTVRAA